MSSLAAEVPAAENHGWRVTFAGLGINLALGVLYSWSIISGGIPKEWGWDQSDKQWPYSIACLVFCLIMVLAGRMQDRLGPRLVATIGGVLVGIGMVLAALCGLYVPDHALLGFIVGFGVLAGAGIGFGYASATPPAVKWFAAARTGLIAGLVVSGFGLASVYVAPLATWLIGAVGLSATVMILGIGFLVVVVGLAQLLKVPPAGYVPAGTIAKPKSTGGPVKKEDFRPGEMLKTWQFYLIWFLYACGAGAGLMVISVAKKGGAEAGVYAVVGLAIGNGTGRIVAGVLSDKLGRKATLVLFFAFQAVMVVGLSLSGPDTPLGSAVAVVAMATLIGANYGSNLSLFPSITKDYYGLKNFGVNYGLVFTAWGIGGFMLAQFAGWVYDGRIVEAWKGGFTFAYYTSAALLVAAAILTFALKAPQHQEPQPAA